MVRAGMRHQDTAALPVSSLETGGLGVRHLKRYWWKRRLELEGRLDRNAVAGESGLDQVLLHGLGLGIVEPDDYLFHERPDYAGFEAWILRRSGGALCSATVARINDTVRRALEEPPRSYPRQLAVPMETPVLGAGDLAFWEENGYVVLRQAVPRDDALAAAEAVWACQGQDPADPDSWYGSGRAFWVPIFRHPALDQNRDSPRIRKAFEQLWGTDDLWATVDRASINRPLRPGLDLSGPSRLHWDVSIAQPMPFGLQGLLYLSDTAAEQGAFRCVPGFHRRLAAWLESLPAGADPRSEDLEPLGPVPVPGAAGDLVIWHHALPHGSGRNSAAVPRVVQYITLFPHDRGVHPAWK